MHTELSCDCRTGCAGGELALYGLHSMPVKLGASIALTAVGGWFPFPFVEVVRVDAEPVGTPMDDAVTRFKRLLHREHVGHAVRSVV